MSQVTIKPLAGLWVLAIHIDDQLLRAYTMKRLIEAIDMASTLQLHIDNVNELVLNQYLMQGVQNETI